MSLIQVEWHPSRRQLRVFGASGFVASIVAGVVLHWVWGATLAWSLAIGAAGIALLLCSVISLRAARVLYLGLTIPMLPISYLVSFLLLAGFYFLVLTPVALVFRLIGRDPLCRRFEAAAESYWVPHKPSEETERYLHQF
jgi:hypothetical protein